MRKLMVVPSDPSESSPKPPAPLWAPNSALRKPVPDRSDGKRRPDFQSRPALAGARRPAWRGQAAPLRPFIV